MEFVNNFFPTQRAAPQVDNQYDINFCFPIRVLENSRVLLTPFIPALHAKPFFDATSSHPKLYRFLGNIGPYATPDEFVEDFVERVVHVDPTMVQFAVFDKTGVSQNPSSGNSVDNVAANEHLKFAGSINLMNTSRVHLSTEIGYVMTVPAFQRTHVTSNAAGLLLQYCLEPAPRGLGLRRVQWQANVENRASVRTAERLRFRMEGVIRWQWVLKPKKEGGVPVGNRDGEGPGRHTAVLSICWDDWELDGKREHVAKEMAREL